MKRVKFKVSSKNVVVPEETTEMSLEPYKDMIHDNTVEVDPYFVHVKIDASSEQEYANEEKKIMNHIKELFSESSFSPMVICTKKTCDITIQKL